jgi:hypothetical protein
MCNSGVLLVVSDDGEARPLGGYLAKMTAAQTRSISPPAWLKPALLVLSVTLILMAPAILNGGPFIFYDTDQYFAVGGRIVEAVLGPGGDSAASVAVGDVRPAQVATDGEETEEGGLAAIAGGRSPIYSLFLYLTVTIAGMWTTAALQALACATLIVRLFKLARGRLDWTPVLLAGAGLAILCGLGFQAAFMMPDVFAGCLVLTLAIYLFFKPTSRIENLALLGGGVILATLHTTNMLLVLCAPIAALILLLIERRPIGPDLPRLGALVGVAVAALAFNAAYLNAASIVSGENVRSLPYLTARVLGDGTGEAYLAKRCASATEPYAACTFANIDFTTSDNFMFDTASGGLLAAEPDLKMRFNQEELRFVLAVIADDPIGQLAASLNNFKEQLLRVGAYEIETGVEWISNSPGGPDLSIINVTPGAGCVQDLSCARPTIGIAWAALFSVVNNLFLPVFAIAAVWFATRARTAVSEVARADFPLMRMSAFLALMLVANAALCGVLAGPADRYQTRLIWTFALTMLLLAPTALRIFRASQAADAAARSQG